MSVSFEHAMEYWLGNYDQNDSNAHYLMFHLSGGFAFPGGTDDKLFVVLDMDWNYINTFDRMYGTEFIWTDFEVREEFSADVIDSINAALK